MGLGLRMEAPIEVGYRKGVPSPLGKGLGKGPNIFFIVGSRNAHCGAFSCPCDKQTIDEKC